MAAIVRLAKGTASEQMRERNSRGRGGAARGATRHFHWRPASLAGHHADALTMAILAIAGFSATTCFTTEVTEYTEHGAKTDKGVTNKIH